MRNADFRYNRFIMNHPVLPPRADPAAPANVLLAFGANLGNAQQTYRQAIDRLNELKNTVVVKYSSLIETDPVDCPGVQPKYHNGAILIQTRFAPEELLNQTQAIESALGRVRTVKNGARTCDLDILLYDDLVYNSPRLTIPHPRMYQRQFVLIPVEEILNGEKGE